MADETVETTIGEIIDDIDADIETTAAKASAAEDGSAEQQRLDGHGLQLDERRDAFEDLAETYSRDATITIADLDIGERIAFHEHLDEAREQFADRKGFEPQGDKLRDLWWTVAGVVEAPWYEGDEPGIQKRAAQTKQESGPEWHALLYLRDRVTEVNSSNSGNSNGYVARRQETAADSETS